MTEPAGTADATGERSTATGEWQRLDPRMLLVHPIRELVRFLPVLIGLFVAGTASDGTGDWWQLLGVAVPVALGVAALPDDVASGSPQGRIELRRGLLNRHVLSTPLDRVRTVDLTASPIHRLLGLTTVRVGTGTASTDEDDRLDLDGLPAERARRLRAELLHADRAGTADRPGGHRAATASAPTATVLRARPGLAAVRPAHQLAAWSSRPRASAPRARCVRRVGDDRVAHPDGWPTTPRPGRSGVAVPAVLAVVAVTVSRAVRRRLPRSPTGGSRSPTGGTAGAWHLRRGLLDHPRDHASTTSASAGSASASRSGCAWPVAPALSAIVTGLDGRQAGSSVLGPPGAPRGRRTARRRRGPRRAAPVDGTPRPRTGHGPAPAASPGR